MTLHGGSVGLIVIDMVKGLIHNSDPEVQKQVKQSGVVSNVQKVIEYFQKNEYPCFFVKVERSANGKDAFQSPTDWSVEGKAKLGRELFPLKHGTEDVELIDELTVTANDFIITKHRVSAFHGTPLEMLLRAQRIETIVVCGVFTHLGVETTVRDARDRDFHVIVMKDGCTSVPSTLHDHSIYEIFTRICRVRTSDELIGLLS